MIKNTVTALCSVAFLLIWSPCFAASDAARSEIEYLVSAKAALLQARELDKSAELGAAIEAVDRSQSLAGASISSPGVSKQGEEGSWIMELLPVVAPFLLACIAVAFFASPRKFSSSPNRSWFSSPKKSRKVDEIVTRMTFLVNDLSVPDEVILEMRSQARSLRGGR